MHEIDTHGDMKSRADYSAVCLYGIARRSWYSNIVVHIRNSGIVSLAAQCAAHR